MLVSLKKIIGLEVYTKSGKRLGKVIEINLDTVEHLVREYIARAPLFSQRAFLIRPAQVVEILADKMIVDDAVETVEEQRQTKKLSIAPILGDTVTQINIRN